MTSEDKKDQKPKPDQETGGKTKMPQIIFEKANNYDSRHTRDDAHNRQIRKDKNEDDKKKR